MSVDIEIRQKGLFKKELPAQVVLGDKLAWGNYDDCWRMEEGKKAEGHMVVWLPDAIARGFSADISSDHKSKVELRLLTPTSNREITEFYETVKRIMNHWKAELVVDGEKMSLDKWLGTQKDYMEFNARSFNTICEDLLQKEDPEMTFFCAMWPLTMGKEEAQRFEDHFEAFEFWMNQRQSMDVYYAAPRFYQTENGIAGFYALTENCASVFPLKPSVPFMFTDPKTGKALECNDFKVSMYSTTRQSAVGIIPYEAFINSLPEGEITRFDGGHILISGLPLESLLKLTEKQ